MIKAFGKRIIVEEVEIEVKKSSLLILPDKKSHITARVVTYGSEVDSNIDIGDIVYLLTETGVPVNIGGSDYLSIIESQVIAAWKDK